MIHTSTTLGDVVTSHPALAGELERRGLDFCGGGGSSPSTTGSEHCSWNFGS